MATKQFQLTKEDKQYLSGIGYLQEDFRQIEAAANACKLTMDFFQNYYGRKVLITRKTTIAAAIKRLGRNAVISGLGRAAFHWSAVRATDDNSYKYYFNCSEYFRN